VIPRSVRLSEAPSFGETVMTLDPASRGAHAYGLLAEEMESRYGLEGGKSEALSREQERPGTEAVDSPRVRPAPASTEERVPVPGPGGRGYGALTPVPPDLDERWPRGEPWTGEVSG